MSTRAMIAVQMQYNSPYELFYRHCDGYPEGLGQELVDSLRKGVHLKGVKELIEHVGAKAENRFVPKPEEAFTKVQGDLEWIYVIRNPYEKETISLEILKTSNLCSDKSYAFPVFWSYRKYLNQAVDMKTVECIGSAILVALRAFEKRR
jgi:hypothetical protein